MAIEIAKAEAVTSAAGTANGYVTVTDVTPFWPGATVYVADDEYIITDVIESTNSIGLRKKEEKYGGVTYGRTTCVGIASGAPINQPRQLVPVSQVGAKALPQGSR